MHMNFLGEYDEMMHRAGIRTRRSWFLNTFFMAKLNGEKGYNYSEVYRWSLKVISLYSVLDNNSRFSFST